MMNNPVLSLKALLILIAVLLLSIPSIYAQTVHDFLNRSNLEYDQGNTKQAEADITKAMEIDPNYSNAYMDRGIIYYDQKNYGQALSDYYKAIELDPKNAKAYNNLGLLYANQGNYQLAISDYNKAIELDPNFKLAYDNRFIADTEASPQLDLINRILSLKNLLIYYLLCGLFLIYVFTKKNKSMTVIEEKKSIHDSTIVDLEIHLKLL